MKVYLNKIVLLLALAGAVNLAVFAQAKTKTECPEETAKLAKFIEAKAEAIPPVEKAIAADERPTVTFCVSEGSVSVRGWQRKEVRALIENGKLGFKVNKTNADKAAAWLRIVGYDPKEPVKPGQDRRNDCLSGSNIEIEVPHGAIVSITSRDVDFKIESVAKVKVQNVNGDVLIRDVREEAEISSLSGSIVAEDSVGKIKLESSTGNVFGIRLKPLNYSDGLSAKSNSGNVTLQDVSHASIDGSSSNSNFSYFGDLVSGGVYNFKTVTGAVTLFLPLQSSFQLNATSNTPVIVNGFKFKPTVQSKPGQTPRIFGVYGDGDATINLVSFGGALRLQKQQIQ